MISALFFLSGFYSVLGIIGLIGYRMQMKREVDSRQEEEKVKLDELVVLIPFRNEANHLPRLIESIIRQKIHPRKYVFIDDHSTDDGGALLRKLPNSIPYEVLKLNDHAVGKKMALRKGVEQSEGLFVLTWDADIEVKPDYFLNLSGLSSADMILLPVVMKGSNIMERFFEMDYSLSNAVNTMSAGLSRPFLASGANLLFKRERFLECDQIKSHVHYASGDDIFLLRDFQKRGKRVVLVTDKNLAVHTDTPQSIQQFISQRLRWIGKGKMVGDQLSNAMAVLAFGLNVVFLVLLIYFIFTFSAMSFAITILLKPTIEGLILFPYFRRIDRLKTLVYNFIYSWLYPFYLLVLFAMNFVYEPPWKGRELYKKR